MKKLWRRLGNLAFWLCWPGLWLKLRGSHRTRLLLICGDDFLVVRGWFGSGLWGLPGGGLHHYEQPIQGLIREVSEEIGLSLNQKQLTYAFAARGRQNGLTFHYQAFVAELSRQPTLRLQSREVSDVAWQPLQTPTVALTPDTRQLVDWWLAQTRFAKIRVGSR